ncbi:hypothetical protein Taro_002596, partial [Colocasia esculenta]|nr:hypothetical protein [Colocasia esculenta]
SAEQSFPKLCSTRGGVAAGDLAFRRGSRRALDVRTLHGAGETSCRSRRWFSDPEKAVVLAVATISR